MKVDIFINKLIYVYGILNTNYYQVEVKMLSVNHLTKENLTAEKLAYINCQLIFILVCVIF